MFAFGVTEGYNVQLFNDPGQYNESALADMDFVVSEAGKRGLKLIIALASNWIYNPTASDTKYAHVPRFTACTRRHNYCCVSQLTTCQTFSSSGCQEVSHTFWASH